MFGLKGWTISPATAGPESADPFGHAAYAWLAEKNKPGQPDPDCRPCDLHSSEAGQGR
jgi:hypothetical protein